MKVNIFDIDNNGKAKITKATKDIWYLQEIIDKYGEQNSLKLFQIFDKCYDLNPNTNPFANLSSNNKYETILRSTYPELELVVDMEDELIEQALDLVEELYATPKYRAHKAITELHEKILTQIRFTPVSLDKMDGNMAEVNKALSALEDLNKKTNDSYKELEEEMNVEQIRGGGKKNRKKQEDLE